MHTLRHTQGMDIEQTGLLRLQLAWQYLSQGEQVMSVAQRTGYRSEAAFSRAFKRAFGHSAGDLRRRKAGLRPRQTRA